MTNAKTGDLAKIVVVEIEWLTAKRVALFGTLLGEQVLEGVGHILWGSDCIELSIVRLTFFRSADHVPSLSRSAPRSVALNRGAKRRANERHVVGCSEEMARRAFHLVQRGLIVRFVLLLILALNPSPEFGFRLRALNGLPCPLIVADALAWRARMPPLAVS